MASYEAVRQIKLMKMPQLAEVRRPTYCLAVVGYLAKLYQAEDPEDDWTGLRDAASRRKRQNRLNVRAYRK
jgi:hypothetical protein